jgi:hypothetical protein
MSSRSETKEELFNLCHASLRNVIEGAFGKLKRRFRIIRNEIEFGIEIQGHIVLATCCLHNFIKASEGEDNAFFEEADNLPFEHTQEDFFHGNQPGDQAAVVAMRDQLAINMWEEYQNVLAERPDEDDIPSDYEEEDVEASI